ncbi:MAG TPA: class I SAM-dependent methyltransferase [Candidatus Dormibacteraeota bacterium]
MTPASRQVPLEPTRIVDYDSGFDYCAFWGNRDYEQWVEARTLRRLLPRLGRGAWFADFGGGFGRNASHYRAVADQVVLVDYSVAQLTRAAERLGPEVAEGRVHLIRADLGRLPLIDSAVDAAMVVRVLHHLTDLDRCLGEMGRTVAGRWLVDVPIKHHALARWRSIRRRSRAGLRGPEPLVSGSTDYPFRTFQLAAVRARLGEAGFRSHAAASVNNFRRWDQVLPAPLVTGLRPAVYSFELLAQRLGRGWWGPSQFLLATRPRLRPPHLRVPPTGTPRPLVGLAQRACCPQCRGDLSWTTASAACTACAREYPHSAGFWDFSAFADQAPKPS